MSTKNRLTISIDADIYELITEMARLQGNTKSECLNDLLRSVHPPMRSLVVLLQSAENAPRAMQESIRDSFAKHEKHLLESTGAIEANVYTAIEQAMQDSGAENTLHANLEKYLGKSLSQEQEKAARAAHKRRAARADKNQGE